MSLAAQEQYRVSIDGGQPTQQTHADVQALVDAQTANVYVMTLNQASGRQSPEAFGITKKTPDAPSHSESPTTPTPPPVPHAPSAPTAKEQGLAESVLTKASSVADKLLSGFSDKLARKLAKMAGQPDPLTGEKPVKPHQAPTIDQDTTNAPSPTPANQPTQAASTSTPTPTPVTQTGTAV